MKVRWSEMAEANLEEIYDYIALDSISRAVRMVDRITERTKQIAQFPNSGRIVPEFNKEDIRELIEGPYRIIYRIKHEQVEIISVFHSALGKPPPNRFE